MPVEERGELARRVRRPRAASSASSRRPCASSHAAARRWSVRRLLVGERQPRLRVLADEPVEREPARVAGQRLEEQAAAGEPVELAGRVRDAGRLEQRAAEPLEVRRPGRASRGPPARRATTSSARYANSGPSGCWSRSRTASRPPAGAERSASIVSRTAAGQPFVALKIRAAASRVASRGTTSAGRSVATSVSISSARERERGAADVRDLALGAQPLDAERRVVARHEERRAGCRARTARAPRRTATSPSRRRSRGCRRARAAARPRRRPGARPRRASRRPGRAGAPRRRRAGPPRSRSAWRGPRGAPGPGAGGPRRRPAANVPEVAVHRVDGVPGGVPRAGRRATRGCSSRTRRPRR